MRLFTCAECGTPDRPVSESYSVQGKAVCRSCAAIRIADPASLIPANQIHPLSDHTICSDCRKDNGNKDFPVLFGLSLCPECRSHRKRIQFPRWIKAACAACVLVGGWGFYRSIRISRGIHAYRMGVAAFLADDNASAWDSLHRARTFMPKEEEFEDLEAYYRGHACMDQENPTEAVRWFEASLRLDPESKPTARMLHIAQRKAAFNSGRFEAYFRASESLLELEGRTPQALLAMAPAWACKFVLTGKDECRQMALDCLLESKRVGGAAADDWIIEGWVKRILDKRAIISLPEFRRSIGKESGTDGDFG